MSSQILVEEKFTIEDLDSLRAMAHKWIFLFKPGDWIRLKGEMGSGKTTLVRCLLEAWGWFDPVQSPTFPLLIEYEILGLRILHIDAFRLVTGSVEPWDCRDWTDEILFVEWAEHTRLPPARFTYEMEIVRGERETQRSVALRTLKR